MLEIFEGISSTIVRASNASRSGGGYMDLNRYSQAYITVHVLLENN